MPNVTIKLSVSIQLKAWIQRKGKTLGIKPTATTTTSILSRIRKIEEDPDFQTILKIEGGDFISLLEKFAAEGKKRRGYK